MNYKLIIRTRSFYEIMEESSSHFYPGIDKEVY